MAEVLLARFTDILLRLPLDVMDRTALQNFWISGFADCDELVRDYYTAFQESEEFKNLPSLIREACRISEEVIQHYESSNNRDQMEVCAEQPKDTSDNEQSTEGSHTTDTDTNPSVPQSRDSGPWSSLLKSGIKHQAVLSFLFIFLQAECSSDISESDKELSLVSARLYFNLLCFPGCKAFGIFHVTIFHNALTCLALKDNATGQNSKRTQGKNGGQKRIRGGRTSPTSDSEEDDNSPESDPRPTSTIPMHVQKELIFSAIVSLERVFKYVPFLEHAQLFKSMIEKLVAFASWEPELVPEIANLANNQRNPRLQNISVSGQAYRNLLALLVPIQGNVRTISCHVYYHLIPSLIMRDAGNAQTIPRHHVLVKEKAVEFVQYVISNFSSDVLPAARILLQQISTRVADRAEFRAKVSQAVVSISNSFPLQERAKMIKWFHKLGKSTKASHRAFALEVMFALLIQPQLPNLELAEETYQLVSHLGLLKEIVEHCADKSPTVATKAMLILGNSQLPLRDFLLNAEYQIDMDAFFKLLINNCKSEKSTIRKAGVQVLEHFVCIDEAYLTELNLGTIATNCRDIAVSVQKQASGSMTNILEVYPNSHLAQNLWLDSQLSLVYADEDTVKQKAVDALEQVLLKSILNNQDLGWTLLEKVADGPHEDKQQHLRKVFSIWLKENKIRPKTALNVFHLRMDGTYDSVAWMFMTFLTFGHKMPNLEFAVEKSLEEMSKPTLNVVLFQRMVKVVIQAAHYLPVKDLSLFFKELISNVKCFKFPAQVISVVFLAIEKLFAVLYGDEAKAKKSEWCLTMIQEIHTYFNNTMNIENGCVTFNLELEEILVSCIFTVGEVFQLCPWHLPKKMKDFIHSLVGSPVIHHDTLNPSSFPLGTPPAPGSLTLKIKAHAIVTFGKICFGDAEFCKSALLTAIKELQESPEPGIRNNLALALTDLLVVQANLVEPYIPNITACFRDPSDIVRCQTLAAVAKLLKEDYIKWKGTLFYRILLCYIDESTEIANMAEYCLKQLLLKRQPHAFAHHFVECIFYFNSYTEQNSFNQFPAEASDDLRLFSLKDAPLKREKLYRFLLRNMPDQERFRLHERLCHDILGPIIDHALPLNADSNGLVKDALMILSSEEIKLTPLAGLHEAEDSDSEMDAVRTDVRNSITALLRKEVIRGVLPIIVSLKQELERRHSPLSKDVLLFFKEFLKDFKNEIKDIFGEDRQMAAEIAYIVRDTGNEEGNHSIQIAPQMVRRKTLSPKKNAPSNNEQCTPRNRIINLPPYQNGDHEQIENSETNPDQVSQRMEMVIEPCVDDRSPKTNNTIGNGDSVQDETIVSTSTISDILRLISTPHPNSNSGKSLFQTTMEISNVINSSSDM